MTGPVELLRQGRTDELWQRYLGYLDLTLDEFMEIQKRKVLEHVTWLSRSELGRKIVGPRVPSTVEEFTEFVPFTIYGDYAPFLLDRKSDALPEEPIFWMCTSGRGGEYDKKWSPVFREAWEDTAQKHGVGNLALSSARTKGDFRIEVGDKLPYTWAPPPYSLGTMAQAIAAEIPIVVMPPEEEAVEMSFEERIETALQRAFREGIDYFYGLSSVLVKIGERFADGSGNKRKFSPSMLHPKTLSRLIRGMVRSKLAGRSMYPKDLWTIKGVCAGGTDTSVFAERIYEYWGVRPIEMYGSAEMTGIAVQTWTRQALTPFPDVCFFEFIPMDEHRRSREEPGYRPKTVLLDGVKAGETYEIVLTSLKMSVFTRYRIGDLVRIASMGDEVAGIKVPQLIIEGRCDDVIDLGGFTRLTERTIWYAIEKSGVGYEEWTCRKELEHGDPVLHLWLELKNDERSEEEVRMAIHESLRQMDSDYHDLEEMLGYNPLRVTLLSRGTFHRYMQNRQAAGAEPAHFKPRHFLRTQEMLDLVLEMDAAGRAS